MAARYEERLIGVFDRLARAAVLPGTPEWAEYQRYIGETGEMPDPMPPPPAPSIEVVRAEKIALLENLAGDFRRRVTGRAMPSEMATWATKAQFARAYLAGAPFPPPLIEQEALARGVPATAVATRIRDKADNFERLEAQLAGAAGKHKDALRALTSVDAILAYDITAGWPAIQP